MSDLNSLIIFAHVVDANGFSKAARRLKMPTSTVSRRIAELEQALGVRLIERSTRSLRLTDVGSEVLEYAQRGAQISEAIDNIASNHLSKISEHFRLAPGADCRRLPKGIPGCPHPSLHHRTNRGPDRRRRRSRLSRG